MDLATGIIPDRYGITKVGSAECSPIVLTPFDSGMVSTPGFLLKMEKDSSGLYTVTVKTTLDIEEGILGSAQISIVALNDGLIIEDFTTHYSNWDILINKKDQTGLDYDYFFMGLDKGSDDDTSLKGLKAGTEIKLFSFRNGVECIGPIYLIQPDDPIHELQSINAGHDFAVLNLDDFNPYYFLTTYGLKTINCSTTSTDNSIPTVTISSRNSATLEWTPIESAVQYELQVREKGQNNWEVAKKLKTKTELGYFYGPVNQIYEYRIITHYQDGKKENSEVFTFSTFPKEE